jgi:hypothetical protein
MAAPKPVQTVGTKAFSSLSFRHRPQPPYNFGGKTLHEMMSDSLDPDRIEHDTDRDGDHDLEPRSSTSQPDRRVKPAKPTCEAPASPECPQRLEHIPVHEFRGFQADPEQLEEALANFERILPVQRSKEYEMEVNSDRVNMELHSLGTPEPAS